MRAVKTLQFRYEASEELSSLFEEFRLMCNDAIRIALAEKPKSRFGLAKLAYPRLKEYGLHTHYILSACEVAYSIYRNKKRKSASPYVKKAFLKLDNQTYSLNHLILRIPTKPRCFIYLTLQTSNYHLSSVDDPNLKKGAVAITECTVSLALSRESTTIDSFGKLGVDVNERNVTTSDTLGNTNVYDTSQVAEVKAIYRAIRAKVGRRTRHDNRISQRLYAKYGRREKNRTSQAIHRVSRSIVRHAKDNRLGIVMEKLKGIRKLYRKGNGQGVAYRARMNSWTFHELQTQIQYKAAWEGIAITYVNPRYTSRNCSKCGSRLKALEGRTLLCPSCGEIWDRDVNASRNIMAALVCAARPSRRNCEGEPQKRENVSNPQSRWMEVESGREPEA